MNNLLQIALTIIILFTAFPVGYLLAYLTKEELKAGRKWFKIISWISIILCFVFLLLIDIEQKFTIVFSLVYIATISLTSLRLSHKRRFVKN
jgi:hypothetical protein